VVKTSIKNLFNSGDFALISAHLEEWGISKAAMHPERSLILGALVMRGQFEEAELFYGIYAKQASLEEHASATMFLGISEVRRSRYDRARKHISRGLGILRTLHDLDTPSAQRTAFYALFGLGFIHHFSARWERGLVYTERALACARQAEFPMGILFSQDLLAHLYFNQGQVGKSFQTFEKFQRLAKSMGQMAMLQTSKAAEMIYRCQVFSSLQKEWPENVLNAALATLDLKDTYSHANLVLEVSRHLIMAGKMSEASEMINKAYGPIFAHRHRRQTAEVNLRLAYIFWWQGQGVQALSLLRSSEANLDARVDHVQAMQVEGLERSVWRSISGHGQSGAMVSGRERISRERFRSFINFRIDARLAGEARNVFTRGQDPLGDLMDDLSSRREASVGQALRWGRLGLLHLYYGVAPGEVVLICDRKESRLLSFCRGDVDVGTLRWSAPLLKMLQLLTSGVQSKESLVFQAFGYNYIPEHHDSLLYANIARLRKALGANTRLLELYEGGYRLATNTILRIVPEMKEHRELAHLKPRLRTQATARLLDESSDDFTLNSRQILLLRLMKKKNRAFISAREHAKANDISLVTAFRDLRELEARQLIVRHGRARATRYCLAKS